MGKSKLSWAKSRLFGFFLRNGGFGMNELMGVAVALILAAFVIIPGLKIFAGVVLTGLDDWWDKTIVTKLFPPA